MSGDNRRGRRPFLSARVPPATKRMRNSSPCGSTRACLSSKASYAVRQKLGGALGAFDVACDSTISAGAPTCHFRMSRPTGREGDAWTAYSRELEEKALTERRRETRY